MENSNSWICRSTIVFASATFAIFASSAAPAQTQSYHLEGRGSLVRQDQSDCNNGNVNSNDPSRIGGRISISQTSAGATTAAVEITRGTPNTSYNFYWKCQRQLGTVQTNGRGVGTASFQFQAQAGQLLTFDMYPNGAPAGNKYQSVQIRAAYVGIGPLVRQDSSDCGNTNVSGGDPSRIGGNLILLQNGSGLTVANVEIMHGTPNTTYTLYWKCQRALGTVRTNAAGAGMGSLSFQAPPGQVLTFDMYPAGAPAGNKFQSVRLVPAPGPRVEAR
jgi:hypothetical protein